MHRPHHPVRCSRHLLRWSAAQVLQGFTSDADGGFDAGGEEDVAGVEVARADVNQAASPGCTQWKQIGRRIGWSSKTKTIATSYTYETDTTQEYRVRACSPAGSSRYEEFNDKFVITPG
jgi:hypothetical protein